MEASSSTGARSNMINQVLSQLGISFVKDRSVCSLSACGTPVCQRTFKNPRSGRKRRLGTTIDGDSQACAVCQDAATGCHYGAVTCDWCKEFFEQSVRDLHVYDCHFSRGCDLRLQRRNHCQGCRWDRCLEVGMVTSDVCKIRALGGGPSWSRTEADDLHRMSEAPASNVATPRPSLPSPTDTESSRYDSGDDEADRRLAQDLLGRRPHPELPISADQVRDALTPLDSPETLGTRLLELERSCLVDLFRWNKRRLWEQPRGGFGAAAANWMPILLATAARHHLAGSSRASGESIGAELADRLAWLLSGREFDYEPLLDQLDSLMTTIGDLCCQLLEAVLELRRDALSDIINMLGDQTMEELSVSLQSDLHQRQDPRRRQVMLRVMRLIAAASERLRSAGPEQRALVLAVLVSDAAGAFPPAPSNFVATRCLAASDEEDAAYVPVLFGL